MAVGLTVGPPLRGLTLVSSTTVLPVEEGELVRDVALSNSLAGFVVVAMLGLVIDINLIQSN